MTDRFESEDAPADTHRALLTLHEAAGTYDGVGDLPGFARPSLADSLRLLAEAPAEEATTGAKLDVLVALARADFPRYEDEYTRAGYEALAAAVGSAAPDQPLEPDQVLSDAKAIARRDAHVKETQVGQALPHHATAFVGEDVCQIVEVAVGGIDSVWVFSEFETDAPFDRVADWVKPQNWPVRGSAMFKGMSVVGGLTDIAAGTFRDHWHGVFLEDVQLFERLKTLLHCDYVEEPGQTAGMTYELNFSVGDKLRVDRGFLLAQNIGAPNGPLVRVKALKIVSFTDPLWNEVAKLVCPFWTDFVRQAAEGGGMTRPRDPDPGQFDNGPPGDSRAGELCRVWIDFFGDAAKDYAAIAGDVVSRMVDGGYKPRDAVGDGATYWSQLAKDWAKAWAYGMEMMEAMADKGLVAPRPPGGEDEGGQRFVPIDELRKDAGGVAAAGVAAPAAASRRPSATGLSESVIVPVPGLAEGSTVACGPLVGIESDAPVIPADAITTEVTPLDMGGYGVRVKANTGNVAAGLYTGEVSLPDGTTVPVALYVSHATATS